MLIEIAPNAVPTPGRALKLRAPVLRPWSPE